MRSAVLLLLLAGCEAPPRTADDFAANPAAAEGAVVRCGRRVSPDCDAARAGLAEARRRERQAAYRETIRRGDR